jgi:hypothetical protein
VASFVFGSDVPSVGASGAVFGLFGVLLAASRAHHPVLDREGRSLVGRIGMLIAINLVFGFSVRNVDNAGHIGGLLAGLWLGFLIVPGRVTTMRSLWQMPSDGPAISPVARVAPIVGVVALVGILAVGVAVGTSIRNGGSVGLVPAAPAAAAGQASWTGSG